ncbi:MAG: hypothetical protein ACT6U0_21735 [Shinella sp.]|uniref:hypothetical protein n=1 Tax=Shinella sp. TaxID=1870904 RepID=UPI004035AFBD
MTIRTSVVEDAAGVETLLGRSYPALMAGPYEENVFSRALPLMTRANSKLLISGTFYVAEEAGDTVGCGGWTFEQPGPASGPTDWRICAISRSIPLTRAAALAV